MHPAVAGSARATRSLSLLQLKRKKKEKKSRTVLFSFVFPTFPWQRCFCSSLVILSYKVPLFHSYWCFWKPLWWPWPPNICGNTGLFKPLYTCVGSRSSPVCTVSRERPAEFFFLRRKKLYCAKASITKADRDFAIETFKGNIYKVRQSKEQQFQDFLFLSIRSLTHCTSSLKYSDTGNMASACRRL